MVKLLSKRRCSKPSDKQCSTTKVNETRKKRRKAVNQFQAYCRSYLKKGSIQDYHVPIFRSLKKRINPKTVLYPGCHRHITASLIFSNVHYVDSYEKIAGLYTDDKALAFVSNNKEYIEKPQITFSLKDYNDDIASLNSYDLLISLSAGIISTPCKKYLKTGGYFFVNDSHCDARTAYFDPNFVLVGVYDQSLNAFCNKKAVLAKHFHTQDGKEMTKAMLKESLETPRSKRSFKLAAESMFYLFQKRQAHGNAMKQNAEKNTRAQSACVDASDCAP